MISPIFIKHVSLLYFVKKKEKKKGLYGASSGLMGDYIGIQCKNISLGRPCVFYTGSVYIHTRTSQRWYDPCRRRHYCQREVLHPDLQTSCCHYPPCPAQEKTRNKGGKGYNTKLRISTSEKKPSWFLQSMNIRSARCFSVIIFSDEFHCAQDALIIQRVLLWVMVLWHRMFWYYSTCHIGVFIWQDRANS